MITKLLIDIVDRIIMRATFLLVICSIHRPTTFLIGCQNPKVVTNTFHIQYLSVIDDRLVEDCFSWRSGLLIFQRSLSLIYDFIVYSLNLISAQFWRILRRLIQIQLRRSLRMIYLTHLVKIKINKMNGTREMCVSIF